MSTAYVVYRVIVAIPIVVWVIADFLYEASRFYRYNYAIWFIFVTDWSLLAICITAVWMAITCVYYYVGTRHGYLGTIVMPIFISIFRPQFKKII